jgi:hypothetical protein
LTALWRMVPWEKYFPPEIHEGPVSITLGHGNPKSKNTVFSDIRILNSEMPPSTLHHKALCSVHSCGESHTHSTQIMRRIGSDQAATHSDIHALRCDSELISKSESALHLVESTQLCVGPSAVCCNFCCKRTAFRCNRQLIGVCVRRCPGLRLSLALAFASLRRFTQPSFAEQHSTQPSVHTQLE